MIDIAKKLIINSLMLSIPLSMAAQTSNTNQGKYARMSEEEIQLQDKYLAGIGQQQIGKMEGAAKLFQEVLEKNPKCDACAFQLNRIYIIIGDNQKAIDFAKKAYTLDVNNKWYKLALAESLEKIGKDKEAAEIFKGLSESNTFDVEYTHEMYFRWAYCLVRIGEPAKALKVFDDLEKKIGLTEDITTKRVTLYETMGEPKKAANEIKKLADKFAHIIDYQHLAADYFIKLGDKATAATLHQRVLKLDPNNSKSRLAVASVQKPASGNADNEIAYLNTLKDLFKKQDIKIDDKIKTFLPYANKIAEGKDKSLAATGLELAQIIEQVHSTDAKAYSLMGDMLYYNGKTAESIAKYKKCIEYNKSIYAVWEQMMYAQEELGSYDDLIKTSEQAMDLFPNQIMPYFFNGLSNEKKGKLSEAETSLEQAVMMSSKKPSLKHDALIEMGVTYSKSKSYDKSDKAFEEALKLNNKSSIAMMKYANSLLQQGKTEKAQPMAEEALKLSMESDPSVLELYGDYLFKSGNKEEALKYWSKAKGRGAKSAGLEKKIIEKNLVE
jgi:tetratricopeptide (TPR) repeat protein